MLEDEGWKFIFMQPQTSTTNITLKMNTTSRVEARPPVGGRQVMFVIRHKKKTMLRGGASGFVEAK